MGKRKRITNFAIIGLILLIAILGGLFFKAGYLPIVGEFIANEKIRQYKAEVYQSNNTENTKYNLKSAMYESMDNRNNAYGVSYDLVNNYLWDEYQINLWNDQLRADFDHIKGQMPEHITLKPPHISGFLNGKDYSKSQSLYLSIFNEEKLTVAESEKRAAEYTMKTIDLLGEEYNIAGVQIWYFDRNGGYIIEQIRNKTVIDYGFLLKNTEKMGQLGEVEEEWISTLQ